MRRDDDGTAFGGGVGSGDGGSYDGGSSGDNPPSKAASVKSASAADKDMVAAAPSTAGAPESAPAPDDDVAAPYVVEDSSTRQAGTGHAIACEDTSDVSLRGKKFLAWMLAPVPVPVFFDEYWEEQPLLVRRSENSPRYLEGWFSSDDLFKMVEAGKLTYGVDVDLACYRDRVRTTPSDAAPLRGRTADITTMKRMFSKEQHSIRLKCPQMHSKKLWRMIATLEDYFQMGGGANVYLTPAGAQGFAPHYDDIEAFVLQLEGRKRWRVYKPPTDDDLLPRFSSPDIAEDDPRVAGKAPIIDVVLGPGDFLYFPRGWVHQATSHPDEHSLHLTVSTARQQSWYQFIKQHLMPQALEQAFEDNVDMRRSLPVGYGRYMGVAHCEKNGLEGGAEAGVGGGSGSKSSRSSADALDYTLTSPESIPAQREAFIEKAVGLFQNMMFSLNFDRAADDAVCEFLHDRQPPVLSRNESRRSRSGFGGSKIGANPLTLKSLVRVVRPDILRIATQEDSVQVWHSASNSHVWREKPPQGIEFDLDVAPALECLIDKYPAYLKIGDDWEVWGLSGLSLSIAEKRRSSSCCAESCTITDF